jgi:molybdopterin/thiamine biosynthesis adenylyltransferase
MSQTGSSATVGGLEPGPGARGFSYHEAFARHLGLISPEEQERLRRTRVAIVGMGGVGGIHLVTLARLGIGGFHLVDPDRFELANFNRQFGATMRGMGRGKAEFMAEEARAINPELDLRVFTEYLTAENVGTILDGVDLLVDGIDFFALDARRLAFREARRRGIWAVTAGPIGFSTAWLTFSPTGMSFDEYFDLTDGMDRLDQVIAFLTGLCPAATHASYMDLSKIDPTTGRGPSAGLACHLCSGVAATEAIKILLGRGSVRPVPWYFQFDAYRQQLRKGRLIWGNRSPWRRRKRQQLRERLIQLGWSAPPPEG